MNSWFRYFSFFILLTGIGYLYEKYNLKQEWDETVRNNDKIHEFLLQDSNSFLLEKPILWIFTNYAKNARKWPSFFSRDTRDLNQPYLELCVESIVKHCGDSFNVTLIDDNSFHKLIPNWDIDMNKLSNPVKEHMRTLAFSNLLYNYGGLIIPNSMVVLRDLKPLYDDMVSRYNVFTFECVDRNSTSVATDFFPNARFLGAKRRSQVMKEYMEFLDDMFHNDHTEQPDFLGQPSRWLFEKCQQKRVGLVNGATIGTKTKYDTAVYIDELMSDSYIHFDDEKLVAVYIPADEILKRVKYEWFARLDSTKILESDIQIAKYLLISQMSTK